MQSGFDFDIAIVGGGMVGAALACALPDSLKVVMVEQFALPGNDGKQAKANVDKSLLQPSFDNRATALSKSSQHAFEKMGLWTDINSFAQVIEDVHVSDQGFWGSVLMQHQQEQMDALGYVIENRALGHLIFSGVLTRDNVSTISPAEVAELQLLADGVQLDYRLKDHASECHSLTAKLLIVADGAQSFCCHKLGIRSVVSDYGHSAIVANLATSDAHKGIAYERFTGTGPLALLPLLSAQRTNASTALNRSALVWTLPSEDAESLMSLDDDAFLQQLQTTFGFYQGDFLEIGQRSSYPLSLSQASEQVRNHVVVMGNAAHSLHPVAGQGFNLALRDVMLLADIIDEAAGQNKKWNKLDVLEAYLEAQKLDQWLTTQFSDFLPQVFTDKNSVVKLGRNLGLLALELLPSLKSPFVRFATGYR